MQDTRSPEQLRAHYEVERELAIIARDRLGHLQTREVVSIEDRAPSIFIWTRNPYAIRPVKHDYQKPAIDYLAAYWMGRYHGFLTEED